MTSDQVLIIPSVGPLPTGVSESLLARGLTLRFADALPEHPVSLPALLIVNQEALAEPGQRSRALSDLVRQRMSGPFAAVPTLVLDPRDRIQEDVIGWAAGVDAYLRPGLVPELLSGLLDRLLASNR